MIREVVPQPNDSDHDAMLWTMQSTHERDQYLRTFPNPIPDTHELVAEWDPTGMRLTLAVRPRLTAAVAGRAEILSRRLTHAVDNARRELDKLTKADLLTKAAELQIADKIPGSATKPQIIALLVARADELGLLDQGGPADDDDDE